MSGKRNWGDNMTHRMDGKEAPSFFERFRKVPSKNWKKKYKCKKNKGDHTPVIKSVRSIGFHQYQDGTWSKNNWGFHVWVTWECTACKKRLEEFRPPEKKFDKYRYTIWSV